MEVAMLLCDAAEAINGKLYILGAGWSLVLVPDVPANMSLAVKLGVPWHEANDPHTVIARLVDAQQAQQVEIQIAVPDQDEPLAVPVRNEVRVETGRPPGLAPGTDIDAPLVFNFNGLALPAGGYVWELEIDGTVEARSPFRVGPVERR